MISDVLSDACIRIEEYRNSRGTKKCYERFNKELSNLLKIMRAMRVYLDSATSSSLVEDIAKELRELNVSKLWKAVQLLILTHNKGVE